MVWLFVAATTVLFLPVEYRLDFDFEEVEPVERSAAVNMALDEYMLERAAEDEVAYLRVYGFEEPAFVPSRRTSVDDIASALENGYDFTRRETNGSTIPCLENCLAYSVAYPTQDFPDRVFEERVAPALMDALTASGISEDELNTCLEHDAIRYGDRGTPEGVEPGKTLVGSSLWRNGGSVLSHGVIAVEPWDTDFLDENMELREGEPRFLESFPSVDGLAGYDKESFVQFMIEGFTGGDYMEADLGVDEIGYLMKEKYRNSEWTLGKGVKSGEGHCFVEEEEGRFY